MPIHNINTNINIKYKPNKNSKSKEHQKFMPSIKMRLASQMSILDIRNEIRIDIIITVHIQLLILGFEPWKKY